MFHRKSTYFFMFTIIFIVFFFLGYSFALRHNKSFAAGYESGNVIERVIGRVVNLLE